MENLRRLAREQVENGTDYLERWYSRTYGKPTYSGDFEDRSEAAWQLEMLRELWHKRQELMADAKSLVDMGARGKQASLRMKSIYAHMNAINQTLGEPAQAFDPVTSAWEAKLKRGEKIDLDGHVRKLKVAPGLQKHLDRLNLRPKG
jgi:hypothetical protein